MKFAIYNHKLISADEAKAHLIYKCPFCGKRMVCHNSSKHRRAYFAHVLSVTSFNNPGETSEHVKGKYQLARFFESSNNTVVIERYLQRINQWPDLMVNDKVIEFQCSPISSKKLMARISGYAELNLKSWWILGSPYQRRHLRPSYLVRFLNYSVNLGFFILFWEVKAKCLTIHYGILEKGGHLEYRVKRLYTLRMLKQFLNSSQLPQRPVNNYVLKRSIASEMRINRKRLFYGDQHLIRIQQMVSQHHNTILGCPIICHLPIYNLPIFGKRALLWRIVIILLIQQSSGLWEVYHQAELKLNLPLTFCQLNNYESLYQRAFLKYVQILEEYHYVKIDVQRKKITRLREPRWFSSYYDKLSCLKFN